MVFLKTGMYEYVLIECNDILEIDPRNAKILARRAKANTSLADRPGTGETFDERKAKHNKAIEDLNKCIEILEEGCLDAAKMKLKEECEEDLRCLFRRGDDFYTELAEGRDGLKHHMNSGKFISVYVLFDSITIDTNYSVIYISFAIIICTHLICAYIKCYDYYIKCTHHMHKINYKGFADFMDGRTILPGKSEFVLFYDMNSCVQIESRRLDCLV